MVSADMVAEAEQPAAAMLDRIVGYWVSCAVHVAAKLGLADQLSDGPRTVEELASATGSHASSLYRLLRMLAASGVFPECADGRFENTRLSETLRSDMVSSMRGFAVMMVHDWDDDRCVRILSNWFRASQGKGKVLVVDTVTPW